MTTLSHKIDFAVILTVQHANPNGDPLNGNRPRYDYEGKAKFPMWRLSEKSAIG